MYTLESFIEAEINKRSPPETSSALRRTFGEKRERSRSIALIDEQGVALNGTNRSSKRCYCEDAQGFPKVNRAFLHRERPRRGTRGKAVARRSSVIPRRRNKETKPSWGVIGAIFQSCRSQAIAPAAISHLPTTRRCLECRPPSIYLGSLAIR